MTAKAFGSKIIESHVSYKEHLASNNPLFNERMKRIVNKNFVQVREAGIFEKRNTPTPNLFFFQANRYNSAFHDDLEDYIVQEIDHFYNNFDSSFALVYVHSSIYDFIVFRRMIEKWPEHFFNRLRKIYILGPSVMVRFLETFSMGTFYRLCDQLFLNVEHEAEIHQADLDLLKQVGQTPTPIKTQPYKDSIKIIKNNLYGKTLDEYDLTSGRYPAIILQLLTRLLKNPAELKAEGIFRKSCDHDELERLELEIIGKKANAIDQQTDIFVVAGCLKKILNNLQHPLFNYGIYGKVINFQGGDELELIKGVLADMEYVNNKTFVLLLVFMTDYVVAQKESNKMSGYNLAVIFGPCFFRPREYDLRDLIYSGKFAKVLVTLFDRQEDLIDPAERALAKGTLEQLMKHTH